LLNTLAIVTLFFIIGELVKKTAGENSAFSAMLQIFSFAAILYKAGITPKRLINMYATAAIHFLPVFTFTTQYTAS
jgi:uncharacterized membrane protein YhaH (DUF805 family)